MPFAGRDRPISTVCSRQAGVPSADGMRRVEIAVKLSQALP